MNRPSPIALFFFKAADIPAGARWITVHPHGEGKGQAVLVQPVEHGSSTMHVIGGAGGKLNYMKLTGVKSEEHYAKESAERGKQRRADAAAQKAKDKELGVHEQKQAAKEEVTVQRRAAEVDFIHTVADAMGWDKSAMGFDDGAHADVSDEARNVAQRQHHQELLKRAKEAVGLQRRRLLVDADARKQAFTGETPLHTDDTTKIGVSDLDPVRPDNGTGFDPDYKGRAEKAGYTEESAQKEKQEIEAKNPDQPPPKKEEAGIAQKIQEELDKVNADQPDLPAKIVDVKQAVALLKAQKKLAAITKAAKEANRTIDRNVEPQAYVIKTSDVDDAAVAQDVENGLRTMQTVAFLKAVKDTESKGNELEHHVAAGSFNSINAMALAAGGAPLVDRSVVDVLGTAAAAQVLARRLRKDLGDEKTDQIAEGMGAFHLQHYQNLSKTTLADVAALHDEAAQMDIDAAAGTEDILVKSELNRKRMAALDDANKLLGRSLGEMEANAALHFALQESGRDSVQVSLGKTPLVTAIKQLRAIGLQKGDYSLEKSGGNHFLQINESGMDKLASPVDAEGIERVQRNLGIMNGKEDEDGWMPKGFANRADLALNLKPGVADSMAKPFEPGDDLEASLKDYIGSRAADGDSPADILSDVQSHNFFQKVGSDRAEQYRAALDKVAPNKGKDGKSLQRAEELAPLFDQYADEHVSSTYGGERSPLNKQSFEADHTAQEALHRALSAEPTGVAAYKQIGDLHDGDRRALRDYFYKNVAKETPEHAQFRADLDDHMGHEPQKMVEDLFGEATVNPDWHAWDSHRNDLVAKLKSTGLNWPDYAKTMRGHASSYSAIQDLVRSKVSHEFAQHYNTLKPDAPIKIGKTVIRGNLNHLDAVDPAAREARINAERQLVDSLRDRDKGKYTSGGVADKLDEAKKSKAAFEQSQMGFFSSEEHPEQSPDGAPAALGADERHTIGQAAENKIASMMDVVGKNFVPGQPVKLFHASMSGKDGVKRQRAIKYLVQNKRMVGGLGVGSGKAQPLDAKILTPDGWRRMGDMAVGDAVIAGDGSVATVTGVFPQGVKRIYRVVMADGGETECCDDHLWLTTTEVERKRAAYSKRGHTPMRERLPQSGQVRSLAEIRATLKVRHGISNHHIPLAGMAAFEAKAVPIAPYLLGALLGDGDLSKSNSVRFSSVDEEMLGFVAADLPTGLDLYHDDRCNYRITSGKRGGIVGPNTLAVALASLGLAGTDSASKFIPDLYLQNAPAVRLQLLRGLMDTDGCAEADGLHCTFTSISLRLIEGVEFLVRSLGGISRRKTKLPRYRHNGEWHDGQMAYVLTIAMPPEINPFRLSRKADKVVPKSKYAPRSRVVKSVEHVGEKEAQCIRIDHPSHLYVTDDFIVTHNTGIGLGAFAHLHSEGKIKKGVFVVPSIVQGQFGAEALRFLEPGKFKWHCEPGASHEDRMAAYKDADTHFHVVTHQSFRDDILKIASKHEGITPDQAAEKLDSMSPTERAAYVKQAMDKEGISFDYAMADEGHGLLNREGKDNSRMSNAIEGVTDNAEYYLHASGDPVKNDASEAFDLLAKMDRKHYNDRASFMRRYGGDTLYAKEGLRRELARYAYTAQISPDVNVSKVERHMELAPEQHAALDAIDRAIAKARIAKMNGTVDVQALKEISPDSFENADESQHQEIAQQLTKAIGVIKNSAINRVINAHPKSAKLDDLQAAAKERPGRPGVVFARSLHAVEQAKARLEKDGHRVVVITGADSSKDKAAKIRAFNPDSGERKADIVICSDAGAVGANLQSGSWLYQMDTPDTAMVHAQRNGRIARVGQKNDVELLDAIANHPQERRSRERLAKKHALREVVTSPLDGLDDTGLASFLSKRTNSQQQAKTF